MATVTPDSTIYKACAFVSQQAVGTLLEWKQPPEGVHKPTWGVILSQLDHIGVVKRQGWHKPYEVTSDGSGMDVTAMIDLWRVASKSNKTGRKKKPRGEPVAPVEPEPPPPPEEIEIDIVDVLRRVLRTGSLDLLLQAAKLEFGAPLEDQSKIKTLEDQIVALERAESSHHTQNASLHEANRRLREELFNERRKMQDLRAQLQSAQGQTKIIEKIIKVGPVPPGGQSSGGSQGFKYPRTHGQHMSKGGRPVGTSGGGVVAVYRKKHKK